MNEQAELIEQLLKDIKDIQWHIEYHENLLHQHRVKMQIAEYSLKHLTETK
jgi:hypothetical protein